MHKVAVDSSVIIKWLNQHNEDLVLQAESVLVDARSEKILLLTPELAKYEIGNALLLSKKLAQPEAKEALEFLFSLPVTFVSQTQDLANQTYQIAQQSGTTYYDASFLSLAKYYGATLVTDNIKHQGKDSGIKVVSLKDY